MPGDSREPPGWPNDLPFRTWRERVVVWEMSQGQKNVTGRAAQLARNLQGERRTQAERWCVRNPIHATTGRPAAAEADGVPAVVAETGVVVVLFVNLCIGFVNGL